MDDQSADIFKTGLRNAHALEQEALSIMQAQVSRLEHYPRLEARLREHIEETKTQKQRLEEILSSLGDDTSTFKDVAASIMGSVAAMGHALAGDEILKNSFADFAFENFEIASYQSLITMAKACGQAEAIPLLQRTLDEEVEMASWLSENLPDITLAYLGRENAGLKADR